METLYFIGCVQGAGAADLNQLFNGLWAHFQTRAVVRRDGAILRYYDGIKCPFLCLVGVENLIATTNAQCSGFTDLLVGAMQVHGAVLPTQGAPEVWKIQANPALFPNDPSFDPMLFFLIADYMFVEPGTSGVPAYPYRGNHPCVGVNTQPWVMNWPNNEAIDVAGVPAQGSPDQASVFGLHWVVRFNNQFWDPSYGVGPFNNLAQWEDGQAGMGTRVAGFMRFLILQPGVEVRPVVRKNNVNIQEMLSERIFPR